MAGGRSAGLSGPRALKRNYQRLAFRVCAVCCLCSPTVALRAQVWHVAPAGGGWESRPTHWFVMSAPALQMAH
jgi:hypothetical protein